MLQPYAPTGRSTEPNNRRRVLVWVALVVLCASAQAADAGRLFRYRDAQGVMHISSNLPPGQAQAGYEVLDSRTLKQLEKVEPRLTPQQLAERARQRQRAAVEAEEAARARRADLAKQNRDRMLLQAYSSEQEILRLRDSKLGDLERIGRGIENTIRHLRQNLADVDATIAAYRDDGRAPPAVVLERRASTEDDLSEQLEFAARIRAEHAEIVERFAADLNRYRLLTGSLRTTAHP